jgi:hypothetical protein
LLQDSGSNDRAIVMLILGGQVRLWSSRWLMLFPSWISLESRSRVLTRFAIYWRCEITLLIRRSQIPLNCWNLIIDWVTVGI